MMAIAAIEFVLIWWLLAFAAWEARRAVELEDRIEELEDLREELSK